MMRKFNPNIFCLVVTRADNDNIDKFCSKLGGKWAWAAIVADGYSGKIIVTWQNNMGKVTPLVKMRYALHLVVTTNKDES